MFNTRIVAQPLHFCSKPMHCDVCDGKHVSDQAQRIAELEAELAKYKCDPSVNAYMIPTHAQLLAENKMLREKLAKHEPEELLPCPFCGSNVTLEASVICKGKFVVMCSNSDCYSSFAAFTTEEIAIKAWNKRVE